MKPDRRKNLIYKNYLEQNFISDGGLKSKISKYNKNKNLERKSSDRNKKKKNGNSIHENNKSKKQSFDIQKNEIEENKKEKSDLKEKNEI